MKNRLHTLLYGALLIVGSMFLMFCSRASKSVTKQTDISSTKQAQPAPKTVSPPKDSLRIAFYNVENLFDTIHEPFKMDSEYLPTSPLRWTRERYEAKQKNIVKVIDGMGYPSVLGLAEIENKRVLEDLTSELLKKGQAYGIVHYESPDERGIDCALIYKKTDFTVQSTKAHKIVFPHSWDKTRDILEVEGLLRGVAVSIFVNHWPSRRGSALESEEKRLFVATTLRQAIDSLQNRHLNSKVIVMGDLNDEPSNISLTKGLGAHYWNRDSAHAPIASDELYNLGAGLKRRGLGSYWYKGEWEVIDQLIVSGSFLDSNAAVTTNDDESVFNADLITYKDKNGNKLPNRTYTGPIYRGGYSDHFPIHDCLL